MSPKMRPRESRAAPKRRVDYRAPAFLIDDVALEFDLDPDATVVTSTLTFRRNPAAQGKDRGVPLALDGEQQENVRLALDGRVLGATDYEPTASGLTILRPPERGTLKIVSTNAPSRNAALEGLYISSGMFCTQCEPEGFRRITHFPDRPDVLARYRVTIRADRKRYPTLLSNGNLVASGDFDKDRHYATWHDPYPKPTYLFALVAGDLAALEDSFLTASGRCVALRIFSSPQNLPRCRHAMDSLKRAMRWDEVRSRCDSFPSTII